LAVPVPPQRGADAILHPLRLRAAGVPLISDRSTRNPGA
jgi:hypothetical protein